MATMLNVYNLNRKKTAVLQNAFDVTETHQLNQIYTLSFSLPAEDPKAQYCLPRHYVRYGDKGELYRIIKPTYSEDNVSVIKYDCEHVITTLCDNVMFGSYTYGGAGVRTSAVITWLLNQQKTKNWKLGTCDFDRKFEYGWEQENLLNALYSIPKEFAQPYQWTFDTTSYPWTVNLKKLDISAKPQYYLRAKRNILSSGNAQDYSEICTRIYPLGYGEGVNQLGITEATVNAQGEADENGTRWGKTYIESPQSIIDQYGIIEKVLVDRRFENANSLYAYAKTMLEAYQTPGMSRSFDVTDLYQLTNDAIDKAEVGYITKLTGDGTITYITKTVRNWDIAGDLQIDLSTKSTDIASSIADLADRVRIESVYAQGATQLYQHSKDANAAPSKGKGMNLSLYFPAEMKQINKVLLNLELKKFRYYSSTTSTVDQKTQTTSSQNQKTQTTSSQAQRTQTTSGGSASGSTSQSTGGGGGGISVSVPSVTVSVFQTDYANWTAHASGDILQLGAPQKSDGYDYYTNENGEHEHDIYGATSYDIIDSSVSGTYSGGKHKHIQNLISHYHQLSLYSLQHSHSASGSATVSVSNSQSGYSGFAHSHTFNIGAHDHTVTIPAHDHTVTIPAHDHTITPNIYESTANPTKFDIYVGGTKKATVNAKTFNGDITQWLLNDRNQVPRDSWINIEIVPNTLAYVVSSVFVQGFVQSRGGGNY